MSRILSAIALLLPNAINGITFSFVNPVFPGIAKRHQMQPIVQGLFFAIFAAPQLFVFSYIPFFERTCGAKRTYVCHLLIIVASMILMSFVDSITSDPAFSVLSIFFRLLNGLGDAGITYQYRALAKRLLPSHFSLMNELTVAIFTISTGIGPLISAPLTASEGFQTTCLVMAALAFLVTIFTGLALPTEQCQPLFVPGSTRDVRRRRSEFIRQQISYLQFLKQPRVLSSLILVLLAYFMSVQFVPILSLEVRNAFQVPQSNAGGFFLAFAIAGILSATPGILFLRKFIALTSVMLIGVIVGVLSNALLGLAPIIGSIVLIWMGLSGLGAGYSFMNIPFVPYMVKYYSEHPFQLKGIQSLGHDQQVEGIIQLSVGMYSTAIGVGYLTGPLIGKGLKELIGFEATFFVLSAIIIGAGIWFGYKSRKQVHEMAIDSVSRFSPGLGDERVILLPKQL